MVTLRDGHISLLSLCLIWTLGGSLLGCSSGGNTNAGVEFEVLDSAGVQIVSNRGTGEGGGERLGLEEDLRLGSLEGDREELLFFNILDILLDERGRIYVGNDQTGTVRLFDSDGTFVREFGGKGQGPAEIPSMLNDLMWAGDQIALIDWQMGGKTVLYDTTGEFSRSFRNTQPNGRRIWLAGFTPQGWLGAESTENRPADPVAGRPYAQRRRMRRVSPAMDSLEEVVFELPARMLYGNGTTGGLDWPLFDPPEGSSFDALGNYYRLVPGEYRIDVWDPLGVFVRSVRRTHDSIAITDEDIEAYKEQVRILYDTLSRMPEAQREPQLRQFLDRIQGQAALPMPGLRPPLKTLLVASDGAVWVERLDGREPAEWWLERSIGGFGKTPGVETDWDIFSANGRFVGSVRLPVRFRPMAVSETSVVGVQRDEFDVEYVVRYRVVRGP